MKQTTPLTGHRGERHIYRSEFLSSMQRVVVIYDQKRGIVLPKEVSEDLAYLCGIFAGDGSIGYRRKKNEYCLKVVGNPKDEQEFYHKIIGPKFQKIFGVFPNMKYHDSQTTYGFSIYSKTIYVYLVNIIGLPSGVKYESLKIPEVFLTDERLIRAFIRGVFDTDGYITFRKGSKKNPHYPRISLSSKSAKFLKQIADFLKLNGFRIWEQYNAKKTDYRIQRGYTVISTIEILGHKNLTLWMNKIGFSSPKHLGKIRKHKPYKDSDVF